MVTGRESQLTVFRPPSCLWRLWMDLASLLLLWCWGHHQGGCESSDPKVWAVWAKNLVGRAVPIGTSAAPGEVPSVRIPMDYLQGTPPAARRGLPIREPQASMDVERACLAVRTPTQYTLPLFQSADGTAIQTDQRLFFERASGLSQRPAPNPHSL